MCVTVIKKRRAVTFAHGALEPGKSTLESNVKYDVKVVKKSDACDWVLLESDVDLCENDPICGPVVDGHRYIQLGLSAIHQLDSPFSISTGVVCSERLDKNGHTLGSAGVNPGDSGGPCFKE